MLSTECFAPRICQRLLIVMFVMTNPEKKGLMFMETSALDSTNVEAAFNAVLTGTGFQSLCPNNISSLDSISLSY